MEVLLWGLICSALAPSGSTDFLGRFGFWFCSWKEQCCILSIVYSGPPTPLLLREMSAHIWEREARGSKEWSTVVRAPGVSASPLWPQGLPGLMGKISMDGNSHRAAGAFIQGLHDQDSFLGLLTQSMILAQERARATGWIHGTMRATVEPKPPHRLPESRGRIQVKDEWAFISNRFS